MESLGKPRLTWGGECNLEAASDARDEYLAALREADKGDFARLIVFATR